MQEAPGDHLLSTLSTPESPPTPGNDHLHLVDGAPVLAPHTLSLASSPLLCPQRRQRRSRCRSELPFADLTDSDGPMTCRSLSLVPPPWCMKGLMDLIIWSKAAHLS